MKTRIYATPAVKGLTVELFAVIRTKCVFKNQNFQCAVSSWTHTSIFHSLDVVGRGSETQLQVGDRDNLNYLIERFRG